MRQIAAEIRSESPGSRLCATALLRVILGMLVKHYGVSGVLPPGGSARSRDVLRLQPVFDHIDKRCADVIRLEQAAAMINMSKTNFARLFRRVTGQSLVEYLLSHRVAKARTLLHSTGMSIAEVGQEAGFANQSHFGAVFRKLTGVSAREYRAASARIP